VHFVQLATPGLYIYPTKTYYHLHQIWYARVYVYPE